MFRVISGCVTLRRTTIAGDMLTLHKATAGGYFAEASIFSRTYHCEAICTAAGKVQKFGKREITALMRSSPEFSAAFSQLLATQVQQYRTHIELLAIRSANGRVMAAIKAGYLETTISEFASRINLSHEACYRALRLLCKDGCLKQVGRGKYLLEF